MQKTFCMYWQKKIESIIDCEESKKKIQKNDIERMMVNR